MAYRFVHAADIHLDSPLRSLALRDPELAVLIGNATRRAFVAIVDLCLEEQVDALLLAGDLYDGDQTSMKTARFLAEQIRRLHQAEIRTFIIRGNHDAMSNITRELSFPETVKIFGGRAEAVVLDDSKSGFPVAIHGLSFARPHSPESLLPKYKRPIERAVNIGLMHTSLGGAPGHDPYAPCAIADLQQSGFRYWALGHVHKRAVVEGPSTIVMPGMPQGRDINEAGPKSVCLVTVADDRSIRVEERSTHVARFERIAVDLSGIDAWPDVVATLRTKIDRIREALGSDHLVARLSLTGTTPLAWRIRRDLDLLKAEADDRAASAGQCWIEKIDIECRSAGGLADALADPVVELRRLIDEDVISSSAFRAEIAGIADELRAQLPQESRDVLGADAEAFAIILDALVGEGADDVLARLQGNHEAGLHFGTA